MPAAGSTTTYRSTTGNRRQTEGDAAAQRSPYDGGPARAAPFWARADELVGARTNTLQRVSPGRYGYRPLDCLSY
jgi:hypothetical protein